MTAMANVPKEGNTLLSELMARSDRAREDRGRFWEKGG